MGLKKLHLYSKNCPQTSSFILGGCSLFLLSSFHLLCPTFVSSPRVSQGLPVVHDGPWPINLFLVFQALPQCMRGYGGCHQDCPSLLLALRWNKGKWVNVSAEFKLDAYIMMSIWTHEQNGNELSEVEGRKEETELRTDEKIKELRSLEENWGSWVKLMLKDGKRIGAVKGGAEKGTRSLQSCPGKKRETTWDRG